MKMSSLMSAQQRTAPESSEQFQTRMMNMVSLLESTDSYFFYKRVCKSAVTQVVHGPFAYALEFPLDFWSQYSKNFGKDLTFVMKDSERSWPIKITLRFYKHSNPRVFAYGAGGWKTFLIDNQIKVGDIIIFQLVGFSQFQVVIGRAPVEVHPGDHGDDNEGEVDMDIEDDDDDDEPSIKWFRNPSPWWNADQAPVACRVCKLVHSCPRFVVAIRLSSHPQQFSLAVPGRFWDLHGNMLESNNLQLRGPNKFIYSVKAKRTYDGEEKKLSVRLESGFARFRVANRLRVGDVLEFFLVGNSCFTVDIVERMKKY